MADWLLLRLPRAPEQPASWISVDARGAVQDGPHSGPLTLAATQAAGRRLCVLAPPADVLLTQPELPARAGAKLQQIVPYALEEQLADDIEELHFAVGKRPRDSTRTPVAVVSRALMDEWLSMLREAGLSPECLYAESELLPRNPTQATALLDDDLVIVRPVDGVPVCVPVDALDAAVDLVRPPAPSADEADVIVPGPGLGLIVYATPEDWDRHGYHFEALRERFDGVRVQLLTDGALALFAQALPSPTAVNLLQGPYTPATSLTAGWRAWRVAAILLAALVGLHITGQTAQLMVLKRAERALDASIEETFRAAMPGERNALDARRRMEQRLLLLREGGGAEGLLPALGALVQARNDVPDTVVQALSYRDGTLDLKIAAPDADSLDRMSQSLRGNGWQADLTAGNVAGSGYEGRIRIRPRGT